MATILDGKKLSLQIAEKLKKEIQQSGKAPTLAIVQVGDLLESSAYIRHKKAFAERIGAKIFHLELPKDISEEDLIENVKNLNESAEYAGIIVQMPLPKHIDKMKVLESVDPRKDVDGMHSANQAKIFQGDLSGLIPATPKGVMSLLKKYKVKLEGKRALVVGRSLLVGRPMAMLLLRANATVTIAHRHTKDLEKLAREHDVIVVAVGKAELIGRSAVKKGQIIVDVGTNAIKGPKTLEEGVKRKLVGDVKFDEVAKIVAAISPVPGGVGPMTVASLFQNLVMVSR
ncbi:MAG: bifunctional 5,10-methylenetetrahydrofolate dehydrogenase/5,10-methenyltetrahydrofolate cyclohydrolase [Patescibacteria group bacterium]